MAFQPYVVVDMVVDGGFDLNLYLNLNLVATLDDFAPHPAKASSRFSASPRSPLVESASSLDVFKLRKLVSPEYYAKGINLLEGVVAMLTKML
jgi:hypothetical protein